jgi:hypothetical protein
VGRVTGFGITGATVTVNLDPVTIMRALLITLFLAPILDAKKPELQVAPVKLSANPALFFKSSNCQSGTSVLYVFDPAQHQKPHAIWSGGRPIPVLLQRVTTQELLMVFRNHLHLVNMAAGTVTPLLDADDHTRLIAVEGKTIFFLRQTVPDNHLGSVNLKTGKDKKTVVEDYHRGRDFLYRHDIGQPGAIKQVSPLVVEKFLAVEESGFWVITADQCRTVARIGRDGTVTEIIPYDPEWLADLTTHSFSPKREYLALAVLHRDQDFHSERTMVVCDLKAKKVCFTDRNIPLGPDLFSGRAMFLGMVWRGPTIVGYGGPFALISTVEAEKDLFADVKSGRRLDKAAAATFKPVEFEEIPKRERRGSLELAFGQVFFPGEDKPIASVLDDRGVGVRDIDTSADGKWSAYSDPKNNRTYLIDGEAKKKTLIMSGPSHDFQWLSTEITK